MAKKGDIPVSVIQEFFEKQEFTDDIIELDQCTTIFNIELFVESHLAILNAKCGKIRPYYDRLLKLYQIYHETN